MIPSEAAPVNKNSLKELRRLVHLGEGQTVEFKRKVAHADKIVKELIAFGNTQGGTLLIGVDDNGTLPGLRYPEEELLAVQEELLRSCRPSLTLHEQIIPLSAQRFVVRIDVEVNPQRPHYFKNGASPKESFVRAGDKCVKASAEMLEIVRRSKQPKNIRFNFGEAEKMLMQRLEQKNSISVEEFQTLTQLNRFMATRKLILLVLANVMRIHPSEKGDVYSRIA